MGYVRITPGVNTSYNTLIMTTWLKYHVTPVLLMRLVPLVFDTLLFIETSIFLLLLTPIQPDGMSLEKLLGTPSYHCHVYRKMN